MIDVPELTLTIETLRDTLETNLEALLATTTQKERRALRASVERCTVELQRLLYRLITLPMEARSPVD